MKLTIKDYQIIKQAVLEFKPGLTVLVGPSNNGKSSIIKAMKAAIYTEPGTTPIRTGADSYIVGIQKDGHTVVYQKKEGSTKYIVDGEQYSKFGFNTPEEVSKALNIKELQLNGNKIQLNFWDQMDKPFLLDKSAGELFKFIVDSGENDQLSSVLKSMVSDRQQINRDADVVQGSIKSTEDMIKEQENILNKQKDVLSKADIIIDKKERYELYKNIKEKIETFKNSDKEIESIRPKLLTDMHNFDIYNILNYSISQKLNDITNIRKLLTEYSSADLCYHNKLEEINAINNKENILNRIDYNQIKNIGNLIEEYKIINKDIESTSEVILKLDRTIPDIDIEKYKFLVQLKQYINQIKDLEDLEKTALENIKIIEESENELNKIQKLIKVCPYCGHKIGGEHVHRENIS